MKYSRISSPALSTWDEPLEGKVLLGVLPEHVVNESQLSLPYTSHQSPLFTQQIKHFSFETSPSRNFSSFSDKSISPWLPVVCCQVDERPCFAAASQNGPDVALHRSLFVLICTILLVRNTFIHWSYFYATVK